MKIEARNDAVVIPYFEISFAAFCAGLMATVGAVTSGIIRIGDMGRESHAGPTSFFTDSWTWGHTAGAFAAVALAGMAVAFYYHCKNMNSY